MTSHPLLADFPSQTYDKLRYGDIDRQGHINNVAFATFLETGRVALLEAAGRMLAKPGFSFFLAHISIDYLAEIHPPGTVEIGSAVKTIGNSSVTLTQALFQREKCVATCEAVVVQVDPATSRPAALSPALRASLNALMSSGSKPAPAR
ncbi:thioesterase family protein [Acidocella sp.]|uniref:acyl-CoA thioesterase n=1 Tax=Acidocella sp. TaxID=50710 RepID=UPI00263878AE|nr:thioesterase family protein [Acidocella sp.]MDD2794726.1 thioesterase family protein [Acidocella sp.]